MIDCRLCKSNRTKISKKIASPHFDLSYTLYECLNCKCRFFSDKEHNVDIETIYDEDPKGEGCIDKPFIKSMYWSNQRNRIIKYLGHYPTSILDVGCRTGDFLMHFNSDSIREGVEISVKNANIAKNRGLKIYSSRLEDVDFKRRYEVVTAFAVLEHLVDPLGFLTKLNELVPENGILVILTPTHENLKTLLIDRFSNVRWHMYSPPEHLNYFSKVFLDSSLKEKGFDLVDRYWTSGGTFNPFSKVPGAGFLFKAFMFLYDESFFNKLPMFDHLYSVYQLKRSPAMLKVA